MEIEDKFFEKNKDNFQELDNYINTNRDNIRLIIVSSDLFYFFKKSKFTNYIHGSEFLKYRGIGVASIPYTPSAYVKFILKDTPKIEFNIPCICGIFRDEKHP